MQLLAVVTPTSIYHGSYTWNTFWLRKIPFLVNLHLWTWKNCGCHNVRKQRDIKDIDKYIILSISLKFGSMNNTIITYPEPKDYLGRSGKRLITSMGLKTNVRPKENKNSRYAITNVSMMDISKIIKEFEKIPYKGYVRKRPKQEPTDS